MPAPILGMDHVVNDGYNLWVEAGGEKSIEQASIDALRRNNGRINRKTIEIVTTSVANELADFGAIEP